MQGKVSVNGKEILKLGTKVNPRKDKIYYNGELVENKIKMVYILLNKPIDYVTTTKDQFQRKTVLDLVSKVKERVVPVGRLDMYTSGALILSNDGDFINKITHPKYEIEKTYIVTIRGKVKEEELERLRNGVQIEDYITNKAKVKLIKQDEEKNLSRIVITIHEGKNRIIRKMCEAIDKKVLALHRTKIGNLDIKELRIGEWRYLEEREVKSLLNLCKNRQNKNDVIE